MPETRQVYTLVCVQSIQNPNDIVLVEKDRPQWQKGFYNLPGGKVEHGESIETSAIRELTEETGLTAETLEYKGVLCHNGFLIHCYHATATQYELSPREGETETLFWGDWTVMRDKKRLMPNLRLLVPLILSAPSGWVLSYSDDGFPLETYEVTFNN